MCVILLVLQVFITVFKAILKRALASAITMTMYLSSVKYIPIGVANALFNTTPIMTFFIEAIYYKKVHSGRQLEHFLKLIKPNNDCCQFHWSYSHNPAIFSIRKCTS